MMITLTIRSIAASWLMVPLMSPRSTPTIRVALLFWDWPKKFVDTTWNCWATICQLSLPDTEPTLIR